MYAHCLYCNAGLGTNETFETFPVGRRLAFDESNGRLWVICLSCKRWNLAPIDERTHPIEQCRHEFERSVLRVASDDVGIARVPDGVELIRIGAATSTDLAARPYGDVIRARRNRALKWAGLSAVGAFGGLGTFVWAGTFPAFVACSLVTSAWIMRHAANERRQLEFLLPDGTRLATTRDDMRRAQLIPRERDGWLLRVPPARGRLGRPRSSPSRASWYELHGEAGIVMAGRILALSNVLPASPGSLRAAIEFLEQTEGANEAFAVAARHRRGLSRLQLGDYSLVGLPRHVRLALEMHALEVAEVGALKDELPELRAAWKDAEEIAMIADETLGP